MSQSLRRRLRLVCSSDEEDNVPQQQPQQTQSGFQRQASSAPPPNPNPTPNPPEPLSISDDDVEFVDVRDDFSPPPLGPSSTPTPPSSGFSSSGTLRCPISEILLKRGLKLKREWLESCIHALEASVPRYSQLDAEAKAKLCLGQFLYSDMNYSGGGLLPPHVATMHLVDLAGPFVLQVDEIVNISCPLRGRYQNAPSGIKRCLKLSMTDGVQRVFGMEYRPMKQLDVLASSGLKVVICNVHIRRGLLMLVPEALEVLGGSVEELEAARKRLVEEVNKPPRGRRARRGTVPPLATRATEAAWPNSGAPDVRQGSSSTLQNGTSFETAAVSVVSGTNASYLATGTVAVPTGEENVMSNVPDRIILDVEEMQVDPVPINNENIEAQRDVEQGVLSDRGENIISAMMPNVTPTNEEIREGDASARNGTFSSADFSDVTMIDGIVHPLILSGAREIPFTYLASLSAKWAAVKDRAPSVQGKIKCFLTGVKGFQFKHRATYELQVYVDDGSLISEIRIDHNVVQGGIGYSPGEVTAALSSSNTKIANDMKMTLKQFQIFLANFEGTMLMEMNETSPLPIALEMNQGCPASDAWLLLRRLKSSISPQTPKQPPIDGPIDISP